MTEATSRDQLEEGARILKGGGVIAFPTDTVYALGADAFNAEAVARIYEIKGRPQHLSLPIFIAAMDQLDAVAKSPREIALFLARHFWPGGLTLVLPRAEALPSCLSQDATIAVRMPDSPVATSLVQRLGRPITGTSANTSGNPAALTATEVRQQLGGKVDLIIEGVCPAGTESTILDVTSDPPLILRQGIISPLRIEQAIRESYRHFASNRRSKNMKERKVMRIAIGCDHRGLEIKEMLMKFLEELGLHYQDFGTYSPDSVDYPDIAREVGKAVASGSFDQGILICSTGIGMSIAANKIKGIRAALCHNTFTAQRSRQHNDANVLCLGADDLDVDLIVDIVNTYLATAFEEGRHSHRVEKIRGLETKPEQAFQ